MERIRMLEVAPLEAPRLIEVYHTLDNLQELVGGTVQAVYPWDDLVAILCDDDGKAKGYPANRILVDEDGNPYDIIVGTFYICGLTSTDFGSISDADRLICTRSGAHLPAVFSLDISVYGVDYSAH